MQQSSPLHAPPAVHERRRHPRRLIQRPATLDVLDGANAGAAYGITTRDLSLGGICFLLRDGLAVGQSCQLRFTDDRPATHRCEVVRSRPLSNGKYEMAVQFRTPPLPQGKRT